MVNSLFLKIFTSYIENFSQIIKRWVPFFPLNSSLRNEFMKKKFPMQFWVMNKMNKNLYFFFQFLK